MKRFAWILMGVAVIAAISFVTLIQWVPGNTPISYQQEHMTLSVTDREVSNG